MPPDNSGLTWAVPATILTESNGNRYLRLTASPSDCGPAFATGCPTARAEQLIARVDRNVYNPITFSYSYRLRSPITGNVVTQLYQSDHISTGGWVVNNYADGPAGVTGVEVKNPTATYTCVGIQCSTSAPGEFIDWPIQYDKWITISLVVYFDLTQGTVDVTIDGQYKGTLRGKTILTPQMTADTFIYIDVYGSPATIDFDNIVVSPGAVTAPTPTPNTCPNLWNSTLAVPASFGASFNWFSSAKELLVSVFCSGSSATVNIGNGSNTQYIYKTGHTWASNQWTAFNYSGNKMDSGGNWFIGSANHSLGTLDLTQKQSVLAYICDWNGSAWKCGCSDTACTTNYWNLQQFKKQKK